MISEKTRKKKAEIFIFGWLQGAHIKISDKHPDSVFFKKDGEIFAEYAEYNEKDKIFYVSQGEIWSKLESEYLLNDDSIKLLITTMVEKYLKYKGVIVMVGVF